jgi:cytidylate kinase
MSPQSNHVVAALARLHQYVDSQPSPRETPPIAITVSRQAGSGGAEIARAVGERLGWQVYDGELLIRIAEEKGLSTRLVEHLDERCTNWLEEIAGSLSTRSSPTEWTYTKHLVEVLLSLGKIGHCVIVGRGANHVLRPDTTVRIRVVAPRNMRVARTEQQQGMTNADAERWVDKTDADRTRFVNTHFNKDPDDPLNHDLILNSGRYSIDDCAALIVQAAHLKEAQVKAATTSRATV